MWKCFSQKKRLPRKTCWLDKQRTPRILPILRRVLGVLFRYRSIWHKCAACIQRMQYTKGLGLSQQAFCNAKMAFVYTNALLAGTMSSMKQKQFHQRRLYGCADFQNIVILKYELGLKVAKLLAWFPFRNY